MDARTQIRQALRLTQAIAETIRELGAVPEGHLYAQVMSHMTLDRFQQAIQIMINAGLVRRKNHELFWVGVDHLHLPPIV